MAKNKNKPVNKEVLIDKPIEKKEIINGKLVDVEDKKEAGPVTTESVAPENKTTAEKVVENVLPENTAPVATESAELENEPVVDNKPEIKEAENTPGPLPTVENPPKWALEHREFLAKQGQINPNLSAVEILANALNKGFSDRANTTMPPMTEAEVIKFAGNAAKSIKMNFVYSNPEKTKGFILLKEFETEIRCPQEGEFDFGFDYSKGK